MPKSTPASLRIVARVRDKPRHPLVEAGEVADEPQVPDGLLAGVLDLELEALGPPGPLPGRLPEAVALGGEVLERVLEGRLHAPLVDEGPAHLDDGRDVLDADRAGLDAGHAGRAGPEGLLFDDVAGQFGVAVAGQRAGRRRAGLPVEQRVDARLLIDPLPQVEDEVARRQRPAGHLGRADDVAAAALGAGVEVDELLPGEVGQRAVADVVGVGRPASAGAGPTPGRGRSGWRRRRPCAWPWRSGCRPRTPAP